MSAKVIYGREMSEKIRNQLRDKVKKMEVKPKIVLVQVGDREILNIFTRMKIVFAESIGATVRLAKFDRDATQDQVAKTVKRLNDDPTVHAIALQLPFDCTTEIDAYTIVNLIDPMKDVNGISDPNVGKLSHGDLESSPFVPCASNGCIELIKKSGVKIEGSQSVVIGRSQILGGPIARQLIRLNSTVTICHSKTENLEEICRRADILVVATGCPQMVKGSWVKPGALVIDCGMNLIPDETRVSGTRVVGDVDQEDCRKVAGAITPVPGGLCPLTIAMLYSNTVELVSRMES